MRNIRYTKELLEPIVLRSFSYVDVMRELGLATKGGNYRTIRVNIAKYALDISHFTGSAWSKGKNKKNCAAVARSARSATRLTVENALIKNISLSSKTLYRLAKEAGVEETCQDCGVKGEWNGKPIRLHLDHINGDNTDNRKLNLRFMCPNCHSQTPTYGRKNAMRYTFTERGTKVAHFCHTRSNEQIVVDTDMTTRSRRIMKRICATCEAPISRGKHCSYECSHQASRRTKFSDQEILDLLAKNNFNYLRTGKELGISDNAVRKRVRHLLH